MWSFPWLITISIIQTTGLLCYMNLALISWIFISMQSITRNLFLSGAASPALHDFFQCGSFGAGPTVLNKQQ